MKSVCGQQERPPYRLYEVQNGKEVEAYQDTFPQLELIEPHAQQAFDLLVANVDLSQPLPSDQCVPRGGTQASTSAALYSGYFRIN